MSDIDPPGAVVIGHPIGHSRSPLIHRFWLQQYRLAGRYNAADVAPSALAGFIADMPEKNLVGANLTIPHKQLILDIADHVDPVAQTIGAANTLWRAGDGTIHVANTDWSGFLANLDQIAPGWDNHRAHAVLVGAGGAARAVVYALLSRGYEKISVVNRSRNKVELLRRDFGERVVLAERFEAVVTNADILINTSSLGMTGAASWPYALDGLSSQAVVHDIVYAPLETPLLRQAKARGNRIVDGLGMLLHQAVPGFEKWFGQRPAVTPALRAHIIADLEASS